MLASTPAALLVLGLFVSPVVPLMFSWVRVADLTERRNLASLYVATISSIWLMAGALFPITLGRYYTDLRFTFIYGNLLVMLVCAVAVFVRKSKLSTPLAIACLMLAAMWFFVAAINATA